MRIDVKERKILEVLYKNGRETYNRIAKKVGISDVAVMKRIKRLMAMGVIKGFTVKVDPRKLGFNEVSITGIDIRPEKIFEVLEALKSMDQVVFLAHTSGDHSAIAEIWARDQEELYAVLREISSMDGVMSVRPAIIVDILKENPKLR